MTETREVLPMPDRLEPKQSKRNLMQNVRIYFYQLYNDAKTGFKGWLESVDNETSRTGNRLFDRYEAVSLIKDAAKKVNDGATEKAKAGEVYRCIVGLMKENNLGLKLRRGEYKRLRATPKQLEPAE